MSKKCIICPKEAQFLVKGTTDYYCMECAQEYFGDLDMLQTVEQQAQELKKLLNEKIDELNSDINELTDHVDDKS